MNRHTEIVAPAQTDIPGYDDDGNLLKISADGPVMTYDGENRLSSVEYNGLLGDVNGDKAVNLADAVASLQVAAGMTPPGVTAVGDVNTDGRIGVGEAVHALQVSAGIKTTATAARKLAFAYDYMGRRVKKAVYAANNLIYETLFVWNGWNLIEETTRRGDAENSRYFVWGLDLSQSFEGAGGIGGLLCMANANASYHYLYDANGNVGQLVNAIDGTTAAHYEYDPFGNLTAKSGPYADANPFRFSTKYFDRETGLYDFGLRDYLPELGRWTSRDPIEEEGGV
ncbi:MAG: RHS repeat-associated core domain-containing protein, partial [Desulfococcaceae bacterium]